MADVARICCRTATSPLGALEPVREQGSIETPDPQVRGIVVTARPISGSNGSRCSLISGDACSGRRSTSGRAASCGSQSFRAANSGPGPAAAYVRHHLPAGHPRRGAGTALPASKAASRACRIPARRSGGPCRYAQPGWAGGSTVPSASDCMYWSCALAGDEASVPGSASSGVVVAALRSRHSLAASMRAGGLFRRMALSFAASKGGGPSRACRPPTRTSFEAHATRGVHTCAGM
jgi:hypothetical protein